MIIRDSIRHRLLWCSVTALGLAFAGVAAVAQDVAPAPAAAPAKPSAQTDAGEPRADTSATPVPPPEPAAAHASAPAAAAGTPVAAGTRVKSGTPPPKAAAQKPAAADRLELGTATVTGDREQPKVMYIVPWKSSDIGDLSGKPMNSLLDEALAPVDRDEFRRQVAYFNAVKADRPQNNPDNPGAKQVEK